MPPARWTAGLSRRFLLVCGLAVITAGGGLAVKYGRHYLFPKRFAVVEPGAIYRSGYLEPGPLRDVLQRYGIRTILVLLNDEPQSPRQQREERVARDAGVTLIRIGMRGDGRGDFQDIERAADMLADPALRPILVHCAGGVNRTGAVCAAWRIKHCGWDLDAAMREARDRGWSPRDNPELMDHMRAFVAQQLAPTSASATPAGTSSAPR